MKTLSKLLVLCTALSAVAHAQVPLTGSQLQVNGQASLNTQGAYMGWNKATLGETDFQNVQGAGVGGFCWYNGGFATQTQLMCLDFHGTLTVTNLNGTLGATTPASAAVTQLQATSPATLGSQGAYVGWNKGGLGETDFQTSPGTGTGGYNWYTGSTLQMSLNGATGVLTNSNGFVGPTSGTHTGNSSTASGFAATPTPCGSGFATGVNASGNSVGCATNIATANALAATPSQCSGVPTSGIAANGNANCFASTYKMESMIITSGICTTTSTAGNSCSFTSPAWASAFADTGYAVSCTVAPPTGSGSVPSLQVYVSGKTTTFFAVTLQAGQGSSAGTTTTSEIDCIGIHI
jgi:hypothetical protein